MNSDSSLALTTPTAASVALGGGMGVPSLFVRPRIRRLRDGAALRDDGGVVKFGAFRLSTDELLSFSKAQNTCIAENERFPDPTPSVPEVAEAIDSVAEINLRISLIQNELRAAFVERDEEVAHLTTLMRARAAYVQAASNGNTSAIISAGFEVRAKGSPVGELDPPVKLIITLNGTAGAMYLNWEAVESARSYLIQVSSADTQERDWKPYRTSSSTKLVLKNLELGKRYAFRVAAIGGKTGQSLWSAEVSRMAA